VSFSFDWDKNNPPSQQVKELLQVHGANIRELEWGSKLTLDELLARMDGPFIESKALGYLSLHCRCTRSYLKAVHNSHRRNVLGLTIDESRAVGEARIAETQKILKLDKEARRRKRAERKATACNEPIWQDTWLKHHRVSHVAG
jgi:hypothetical protein